MAANFDGRPVTEQNLSEWKAGGYLDWQARLETLAQSRELAADSRELAAATDGKLNDHLTTMLSARYAVALAEWDKQTTGTFQDKLRTLHSLCQDIVRLRRSDHHATRLSFEVKRQKDEEEKTDMEILARFKEWATNEDVRDWICQDWDCPDERERQLMKYYGYEQPTDASPAPPVEDSPEAEGFPEAEVFPVAELIFLRKRGEGFRWIYVGSFNGTHFQSPQVICIPGRCGAALDCRMFRYSQRP